MKTILLDETSYWHGSPRYRRLPPFFNFVFELSGEGAEVHLFVDLINPGWEFICGSERHWGFNFAGKQLRNIAKKVFPEYAAKSSGATWNPNAIKALTLNKTRNPKPQT